MDLPAVVTLVFGAGFGGKAVSTFLERREHRRSERRPGVVAYLAALRDGASELAALTNARGESVPR